MIDAAVFVVMMVAVILIFASVRALTQREPASPSALASARLQREINALRAQLFAKPDEGDPLATEVWHARQAWWHQQSSSTPIEALKGDGIGRGVHEALRARGIATLADFPHLERMQIRNVGPAKRSALFAAYRRIERDLRRRNEALTWAELDQISGGRVGRLQHDLSAKGLAKARVDEGARVRLSELERRHAALSARFS